MTESRDPRGAPMGAGTSLYLDLVRFSAALIVVLEHFRERTTYSFQAFWSLYPNVLSYLAPLANIAVIVFFVLSGYVIAHVIATRENTVVVYAASRLARLYSVVLPALILAAITNWLEVLRYPDFLARVPIAHSGIAPPAYYLATSLFLNHIWLWRDLEPPNMTAMWSLTFEVTYYVGIALFVFTRGRARLLGIGLLAALAGPTVILLAPTWVLGYWAYHADQFRGLRAGVAAVAWVGTIGLLVLLCPVINLTMPTYVSFLKMPNPTVGHLLTSYAAAILFTINVLAFRRLSAGMEPVLLRFAKGIRWIGGMSFALYLFHQPVMSFFTVYSLPDRSSGAQAILLLGGTFLAVATIGRACERSKGAYKRLFLSLTRRTARAEIAAGR